MDVLVTGGDTDLGRTVAEGFRDAGHTVVIAGARRDDLEVAAKELDVDAIGDFRQHRPGQPRRGARSVPAPPRHHRQRPRPALGPAATRAPTRWPTTPRPGAALSTPTLLSAVLTVQILGDHLRSGGSIVTVVPEHSARGQRRGGRQGGDLRLDRRAGQPLRHPRHHRQRGGRPDAAPSRATTAWRDTPPSVGRRDRPAGVVPDHARRAPHHRADAARQPRCAGELRLIFPRSPKLKRGDRPA